MRFILLLITCIYWQASESQLNDFRPRGGRNSFEHGYENTPSDIRIAGIRKMESYYCFQNNEGNEDSVLAGVIFYNNEGYIDSVAEITEYGLEEKKMNYTFSPEKILKKKAVTIHNEGIFTRLSEIEYNENGQELYQYDYNYGITGVRIFAKEYDGAGRCVKLKFCDTSNDTIFRLVRKYFYDGDNLLSKTTIYEQGETAPTSVIHYASKKDNTELIRYKGDKIIHYEYEGTRCTGAKIFSGFPAAGKQSTYKGTTITAQSGRQGLVNDIPREYVIDESLAANPATGGLINRLQNMDPEAFSRSGTQSIIIRSQLRGSSMVSDRFADVNVRHYYNSDGTVSKTVVTSAVSVLNRGNYTVNYYYFR